MIKKEFLQIVDHVKRILREKTRKYQALEASTSSSSKLQPKEIFCTYEEVLECFTTREKTGYGMQTSAFKNQFLWLAVVALLRIKPFYGQQL